MATLRVGLVPLPIVVFAAVVLGAWFLLSKTPLGRTIYAVGHDAQAATKAGLGVPGVLWTVYITSGGLAALGGFISVAQLGIINAGFGKGDEFDAIAAAVLGGASLFGGIGTVFPGTVLGTIMIQMVQAGLVFAGVDLYIQPMCMAIILFVTVYIDSVRTRHLQKLGRRTIMKMTER
jgi:ribose transport system permease protein